MRVKEFFEAIVAGIGLAIIAVAIYLIATSIRDANAFTHRQCYYDETGKGICCFSNDGENWYCQGV